MVFLVGLGAVDAALGALHVSPGWRAETARHADHAEIRFLRDAPQEAGAGGQGDRASEAGAVSGGNITPGGGKEQS